MRPPVKAPELLEAIAAHARAVLAGDVGAAEGYVAPPALDAYRLAISDAMSLGPFDRYTAPGLARVGAQYISKVRLANERASALMQIRWARDGAERWLIAEAEYFPPGRTPWTGVGRPRPAAWPALSPKAGPSEGGTSRSKGLDDA
ncbi:MAG TPA: hypothetical protein VL393_11610 [Candidatus Binataceae bacterium]|jgi:hypothetical protein|nr:hypothetical protein [Candidatus Binataceae bacterium]